MNAAAPIRVLQKKHSRVGRPRMDPAMPVTKLGVAAGLGLFPSSYAGTRECAASQPEHRDRDHD